MKISPEFIDYLMSEALNEAQVAASKSEVPIGAVVADENSVLGRGHNIVENKVDPSAHAEMIAIRDACKRCNNWRLDGKIIAVTLEPCTMCYGAISLARIPVIIFGAKDNKIGALGSKYDLSLSDEVDRRVISGVRGDECAALLSKFFSTLRK